MAKPSSWFLVNCWYINYWLINYQGCKSTISTTSADCLSINSAKSEFRPCNGRYPSISLRFESCAIPSMYISHADAFTCFSFDGGSKRWILDLLIEDNNEDAVHDHDHQLPREIESLVFHLHFVVTRRLPIAGSIRVWIDIVQVLWRVFSGKSLV